MKPEKRHAKIHYVYEHWRPDKDLPFYVGKGHGYRKNNIKHERNEHYLRVCAKLAHLGMCVEIRLVAEGLTSDEALAFEVERIAFWKANGVKLTNRTLGGEGASGHVMTPESRAKMSAAKKGKPGPRASPETRAKMSATAKARGAISSLISPEVLAARRAQMKPKEPRTYTDGYKMSDQARAKISAAHVGRVYRGGWTNKPESEETRAKKRASALRRAPMSPETREKIAASKRGKPRPAHVRAALLAVNLGRKQTVEQIAKRVEKVKITWASKREATA